MVVICGIDEAGKGPVIGDMVVCGVIINKDNSKDLEGLGFDSKSLTAKKREMLFSKIKDNVDNFVLKNISADEIDTRNKMGCNLNLLESIKMAEIINELNPDIVYIDCPHPIPDKFKKELLTYLDNQNIEIIAEHKADASYPIVGAASILAKVTRDSMIEGLKERFNLNFGSGYPSDPKTIAFIDSFCKGNHSELKEYVRHSWNTVKSRLKDNSQKRLLNDY